MTPEIIDAACLVLPDGTTWWTEPDPDSIHACWEAWIDTLREHDSIHYLPPLCTSGVVTVRMPKDAFERVRWGAAP